MVFGLLRRLVIAVRDARDKYRFVRYRFKVQILQSNGGQCACVLCFVMSLFCLVALPSPSPPPTVAFSLYRYWCRYRYRFPYRFCHRFRYRFRYRYRYRCLILQGAEAYGSTGQGQPGQSSEVSEQCTSTWGRVQFHWIGLIDWQAKAHRWYLIV